VKIVIKVGTQSILSDNGEPSEEILEKLVGNIVELQKMGHRVILVSSGAVGYGRYLTKHFHNAQYGHSIGEKQLLASIGQVELMNNYGKLFAKYNILVSQMLLTKQDFFTRKNYLNISKILNQILQQNDIIPILNENDSIAIEELMFTDNDELAGLIASQINAKHFIMISNVDGVYDKNPSEPDAKIIPIIAHANDWPKISNEKSDFGRGGMASKITTARKTSDLGITTHIISMDNIDKIKDIEKNYSLGTKILPSSKKSNIKKWIAFNNKQTNNFIIIKDDLIDILNNKQQASIFPIVVKDFCGDFKKGDMIKILSSDKIEIGIGMAKYDSNKLKEYMRQKNKPEFIHYNYLYIY
jgi:glutamate 5-kinase